MTEKKVEFEEQDHPLKNTDGAFVQVGKNGEPVIPQDTKTDAPQPEDDQPTTIEHR